MQKIKRETSLFLCLLLLLTSFLSSLTAITTDAAASDSSKPFKFEGQLTEWMLDEANGNIYAYSSESGKLYFIDINTLALKNELKLPGLSDIEISTGYLEGYSYNIDTLLDSKGKVYLYNGSGSAIKKLDFSQFLFPKPRPDTGIDYNADTFEKIADLPYESDLAYMDNESNVYIYNKASYSIRKYSVKSALEGFPAKYNAAVAGTDYNIEFYDPLKHGLKLSIDRIVLDEANKLIYAISKGSYKLHIIGMNDLKLKKELMLGERPTDMELLDGKLYIPVYGANYIAVVDTSTQTIVDKIQNTSRPELVEIDGSKLFYKDSKGLYAYDILQKTRQEIAFHDYEHSQTVGASGTDIIFADRENHVLYARNTYTSSINGIYGLSTIDLKPVKLPFKAESVNTARHNGVTAFIGDDMFFGDTHYDRNDISKPSVGYGSKFIHVDDKYFITEGEVYLRSSGELLGRLPRYYQNMQIDGKGNAYAVISDMNSLKKTSVLKILKSLENKTEAYETWEASGGIGEIQEDTGDNTSGSGSAFTDISNHWARKEIEYLASERIVRGVDPEGKSFAPNGRVTRAEFVTMLVRAIDQGNYSVGLDSEYDDVKPEAWYFYSVMTASGYGLIKGNEHGRFMPNDPITREEIAAITVRAMELEGLPVDMEDTDALTAFKDSNSISRWAKGSSAAAVKAGIINGTPDKKFAPKAITTRAESAVILKRLLDKLK
ncbi:MAG TPA: S-layer homology domain-containing protein [Clostridia bacterium]|nr:S-layer homology domain-containing protein [Clostridia bacterium]